VCPPGSSSGTKNVPCYVIKVMDTTGEITFRALTAAEYKKLKSSLQERYVTKGRAWLAAKKKAEEAGEEFAEPKPVKPRYKALGKMSTKTNAVKLAQKYQKRHDAAKREKDEAKATGEST